MDIEYWEHRLEELVDERLDCYHDLLNSGLKEVPSRYEILLEIAAEKLVDMQHEGVDD